MRLSPGAIRHATSNSKSSELFIRQRGFWFALAALLVWMLMMAAGRLLIFQSMWSNWDFGIILDGSYRVLQGQHPHHDFSTPLGGFAFVPGAMGMLVTGSHSLASFNLGIILVGTLFSVMAFLVLSHRLGVIPGLMFGMVSSAYFFTPRTMNYSNDYLSYTGVYNAWAWAVFGFVFVLLMAPILRGDSAKQPELAGIFAGIGLGVLLFLKFTFAAPALLMVVAYFLWLPREQRRRFASATSVSLITVSLLGILLAGGNSVAILRDAFIPLVARQADPLNYSSVLQELTAVSLITAMLLTFVGLAFVQLRLTTLPRVLTVIGTAAVSQMAMTITITQPAELVVSVFVAIAFLALVIAPDEPLELPLHSHARITQLTQIGFSALVLWLVLANLHQNTGSFFKLTQPGIRNLPSFASEPRELPPSDRPQEAEYRDTLSRFVNHDSHLVTVGFNNMYSWRYGLPSPIGSPLYWHKGVTFSQTVFDLGLLNCRAALEDVDTISLDSSLHKPSVDEFLASCSQLLTAQFDTIFENKNHRILIRKPGTNG